jgi:hypothetical protein
MAVTVHEYKLILEPGSPLHKWFVQHMNQNNLFEDWLEAQGVFTTVEWIDSEFKRVLMFESESAWWEFRLAWL